jgi:hypothetical protein
MALYQSYTWVDTETFINDFKSFVEANGWTILAYTAGNSVEFSKGPSRFKMTYYSTVGVDMYGYDSIAGWSEAVIMIYLNYTPYVFISAGYSVYFQRAYSTSTFVGGFVYIADRVGNWTSGGCCVSGSYSNGSYFFGYIQHANYGATLAINGAWTPQVTSGAGSLYTPVSSGFYKPPTPYSNSILLGKYPTFVRNLVNTSLLHPIGFLPNLYNANVWYNNFYVKNDIFTIGADTYYCADNTSYNPCIIKLEA